MNNVCHTNIIQGYLTKQGGSRSGFGWKSWKRRYMVWSTAGISYYESERHYLKGKRELGYLHCEGIVFSTADCNDAQFEFDFITPVRTMRCRADDLKTFNEWLGAYHQFCALRDHGSAIQPVASSSSCGFESSLSCSAPVPLPSFTVFTDVLQMYNELAKSVFPRPLQPYTVNSQLVQHAKATVPVRGATPLPTIFSSFSLHRSVRGPTTRDSITSFSLPSLTSTLSRHTPAPVLATAASATSTSPASAVPPGYTHRCLAQAVAETLPANPPSQIHHGSLREGYLFKLDSGMRAPPKPRFFVLRGGMLEYYAHHSDRRPRGQISLAGGDVYCSTYRYPLNETQGLLEAESNAASTTGEETGDEVSRSTSSARSGSTANTEAFCVVPEYCWDNPSRPNARTYVLIAPTITDRNGWFAALHQQRTLRVTFPSADTDTPQSTAASLDAFLLNAQGRLTLALYGRRLAEAALASHVAQPTAPRPARAMRAATMRAHARGSDGPGWARSLSSHAEGEPWLADVSSPEAPMRLYEDCQRYLHAPWGSRARAVAACDIYERYLQLSACMRVRAGDPALDLAAAVFAWRDILAEHWARAVAAEHVGVLTTCPDDMHPHSTAAAAPLQAVAAAVAVATVAQDDASDDDDDETKDDRDEAAEAEDAKHCRALLSALPRPTFTDLVPLRLSAAVPSSLPPPLALAAHTLFPSTLVFPFLELARALVERHLWPGLLSLDAGQLADLRDEVPAAFPALATTHDLDAATAACPSDWAVDLGDACVDMRTDASRPLARPTGGLFGREGSPARAETGETSPAAPSPAFSSSSAPASPTIAAATAAAAYVPVAAPSGDSLSVASLLAHLCSPHASATFRDAALLSLPRWVAPGAFLTHVCQEYVHAPVAVALAAGVRMDRYLAPTCGDSYGQGDNNACGSGDVSGINCSSGGLGGTDGGHVSSVLRVGSCTTESTLSADKCDGASTAPELSPPCSTRVSTCASPDACTPHTYAPQVGHVLHAPSGISVWSRSASTLATVSRSASTLATADEPCLCVRINSIGSLLSPRYHVRCIALARGCIDCTSDELVAVPVSYDTPRTLASLPLPTTILCRPTGPSVSTAVLRRLPAALVALVAAHRAQLVALLLCWLTRTPGDLTVAQRRQLRGTLLCWLQDLLSTADLPRELTHSAHAATTSATTFVPTPDRSASGRRSEDAGLGAVAASAAVSAPSPISFDVHSLTDAALSAVSPLQLPALLLWRSICDALRCPALQPAALHTVERQDLSTSLSAGTPSGSTPAFRASSFSLVAVSVPPPSTPAPPLSPLALPGTSAGPSDAPDVRRSRTPSLVDYTPSASPLQFHASSPPLAFSPSQSPPMQYTPSVSPLPFSALASRSSLPLPTPLPSLLSSSPLPPSPSLSPPSTPCTTTPSCSSALSRASTPCPPVARISIPSPPLSPTHPAPPSCSPPRTPTALSPPTGTPSTPDASAPRAPSTPIVAVLPDADWDALPSRHARRDAVISRACAFARPLCAVTEEERAVDMLPAADERRKTASGLESSPVTEHTPASSPSFALAAAATSTSTSTSTSAPVPALVPTPTSASTSVSPSFPALVSLSSPVSHASASGHSLTSTHTHTPTPTLTPAPTSTPPSSSLRVSATQPHLHTHPRASAWSLHSRSRRPAPPVYSLPPQLFARVLTVLDHALVARVDPRELLDRYWVTHRQEAVGVGSVTNAFNMRSRWVATEILLAGLPLHTLQTTRAQGAAATRVSLLATDTAAVHAAGSQVAEVVAVAGGAPDSGGMNARASTCEAMTVPRVSLIIQADTAPATESLRAWLQSTTAHTARVQAVRFFIEVAHECHLLQNFFASFAIHAGLSLSQLHRLQDVWSALPRSSQAKLEVLQANYSAGLNYKQHRELFKRGSGKPQLPHMALICRDRFHVEDAFATRAQRVAEEDAQLLVAHVALVNSWLEHTQSPLSSASAASGTAASDGSLPSPPPLVDMHPVVSTSPLRVDALLLRGAGLLGVAAFHKYMEHYRALLPFLRCQTQAYQLGLQVQLPRHKTLSRVFMHSCVPASRQLDKVDASGYVFYVDKQPPSTAEITAISKFCAVMQATRVIADETDTRLSSCCQDYTIADDGVVSTQMWVDMCVGALTTLPLKQLHDEDLWSLSYLVIADEEEV